VAEYCAGVTASWDSVAIGTVVDIKVSHGGGMPLSRGTTVATSRPWSFDMGSIDIACLSTAVTSGTSAVSVTQYGKKATLELAGGGLTYTTKAVMQRMDMVGKVNDITRYALSFKITPE
jgi:hypothetical protein